MYFILAQILFALWAMMFAHFQTPCIKAMREYVPIGNPYTKPFHNRGMLLSSLIAAFLIGLLYGVTVDWLQCLLTIVPLTGIYKVLFDGVIGSEVYGDFYYLGTTAKQDRWINTHFPHDKPGEVKVILSMIIVLLFNVLIFLFCTP
jgi:hypothetical protein